MADPLSYRAGVAADHRRVLRLAGVFLAAALPVAIFPEAVARTAALHIHSSPGSAWLPAAAFGSVLIASLVIAGSIALLLAPGLLIALALNRARSVSEWVLHGFALSLLSVSFVTGAVQALLEHPLTGTGFVLLLVGCVIAGLAAVLLRIRSGVVCWPLSDRSDAITLAGMGLVPLVMLIGLAPKFFWEAFNGDGAHAFESARLLLHQAVPFWDAAAGPIAGFPGTTSFLFAYPASWFIRLFGELEVSARLPLLVFMPALAAGLFALIDYGRQRQSAAVDRWLVWLALTVYVVVIAFSATYSPYSADVALPATQDTLVVVAFLGFALAFMRRDYGWATAWAFMAYVSLPNGLLLMGFLLAAWVLVHRPRPVRHVLHGGAAVAAAVVAAALLPRVLVAAGAPAPGAEYGTVGLLMRFAFLQGTDVARLAYIVVPCGILPAVMLLYWRRQDAVSRCLTLVTVAYFLFAFVQAHAPLHYYIPAMVLPLVVHWRTLPDDSRSRTRWTAATALLALVALYMSWPAEPGPYMAAREVGESVEVRVAGYDRMDPAPLRASSLLAHVVPLDWEPEVPHASFGGSPLVFQYYAHSADRDTPGNYILQRASAPPPEATAEIAREAGFVLHVRDPELWRQHLALRPATPAGARIFHQPRSILFRSVPHTGHPWILDLPAVADRLGFDVEAFARRLGVEP